MIIVGLGMQSIPSTTSGLLISPADQESLLIANWKVASYLIVKLNFKSKCRGMAGGKGLGFAVGKCDG